MATMTTYHCGCGRAATTQLQCGWDAAANGGAGGGQYEPLCEEYYSRTEAAAAHEALYAEIVQTVYHGLYVRTVLHGHVRWVGPGGRFLDEDSHHRLLVDPYGIHGECN
jgi:hypothetical protein